MPALKIWHKLTLAVLVSSALLAAFLYAFVEGKRHEAESVRQTLSGASILPAARRVMEALPQYEQQINESGNPAAAVKQIEDALRVLEETEQKHGAEFQLKDHIAALNSRWQALKRQGPGSAPLERQALLGNTLTAARNLYFHIGNAGQLLLADDLPTYYATELVVVSLPDQQDNLARLWQMASNVALRRDLSPENRARMLALTGELRNDVARAESSLRIAVGNDPTVTLQTLGLSSRESSASTLAFLGQVESWMAQNDDATIDAAQVNQTGKAAFVNSLRFWDAAQPAMESLWRERAARKQKELYLWLAASLGGWLLAVFLGWRIVRGVTRPVKQSARLAAQLAQGQVAELHPVKETGELGGLYRSLCAINERFRQVQQMGDAIATGNFMAAPQPLDADDGVGRALANANAYLQEQARNLELIASGALPLNSQPKSERDRLGKSIEKLLEQTHRLQQAQREHERTQHSMMNLLAEVAEAATGNLTVEAEVKSDATAALADAFNLMLGKLRQIIYKVKETTFQVNQSAVNIQLTTDELANGSEHQAAQLKGLVLGVRDIANLTEVVTEHSSTSAAVVLRSLDYAHEGLQAVQYNQDTAKRIREQVQESAKRINRLGERSQEIAASLQLIKEISGRTSMLALNAAIQAGLSGPAAQGFVVVAEEIEGLAERTANATKQISTLSRAMFTETQDVAAALEATNREAVSGLARAGEIAQSLRDIEEVSNQLTRLIQAVWQVAQKQGRGAEEMAKSLREISGVTHRVASGSQEAAVSVRQLVRQAEELRGSAMAFKLPEKPSSGYNLSGVSLTLETKINPLAPDNGELTSQLT
jgi:twitching motility protein PilJ